MKSSKPSKAWGFLFQRKKFSFSYKVSMEEDEIKVKFVCNNDDKFKEFWKFFVLAIGEEEVKKMWVEAYKLNQKK